MLPSVESQFFRASCAVPLSYVRVKFRDYPHRRDFSSRKPNLSLSLKSFTHNESGVNPTREQFTFLFFFFITCFTHECSRRGLLDDGEKMATMAPKDGVARSHMKFHLIRYGNEPVNNGSPSITFTTTYPSWSDGQRGLNYSARRLMKYGFICKRLIHGKWWAGTGSEFGRLAAE